MLRKILILSTLLVTAFSVAMAQDEFSIETPEGAELYKHLKADVDERVQAHLFVFKAEDNTLSATAVSLKKGVEKKRVELDLSGFTADNASQLILEDIDLDERPEAAFFRTGEGSAVIAAWEWLGTAIYSEPDIKMWTEAMGATADEGGMRKLRSALEDKWRKDNEEVFIREALEALVNDMKICSEKAIIKNGLSTVEVVISFEVDEKGNVKKTGLVESNLKHKPSEKCVTKVIKNQLDFKGKVIGPLSVEYPFEFSGSE